MRRRYYINDDQPQVKYGNLYNWPCTQSTGDNSLIPLAMENAGWTIPLLEINTMKAYLGGDSVAGGKLKEIGETYWLGNVGATNNVNFNSRGAGYRNLNGGFGGQRAQNRIWVKYVDAGMPNDGLYFKTYNTGIDCGYNWTSRKDGCSIILVRPLQLGEQTIPDGQPVGTYTGNDGLVYPTTRIGDKVWMACNLAETKLRNGDLIPVITDNAQWASQTGKAMCYYGNDFNNVFI